jgi:trigger factor
MNITRENIDDLNAVITVKVEKTDYEEKVETVLKDYRKKANIKGFRPGMVPIGLIKKMYGKAVRIDEINKVITENVQKYITDEIIEILGDPRPRDVDQEHIDFETQDDFTFSFELGLSPVIEPDISEKNLVTRYEITIDDKMSNDYIDNYKRRYGELKKEEKIADKDVVKGDIKAIDDEGNDLPGGPATESTSLGIDLIKDQEIKDLFIGKATDETIDFDIRKAYPNDSEIAGILRIKREDAEGINGKFRFTIKEISRFYPAELNQELFDKIYGDGVVNSEEEFIKKIDEEISANLKKETEYKLMIDLKALALEKTGIKLPEDFLKRWLLRVNEKTTKEQIEEEFDNFKKDLKWQLIKNKVARENEVKITEEELLKEASNITRYQFQSYGLYYATDEQIEKYAKETLKREDDAKRIADKILEDKVIAIFKDKVTLEDKSVTADEFNKLFEQPAPENVTA